MFYSAWNDYLKVKQIKHTASEVEFISGIELYKSVISDSFNTHLNSDLILVSNDSH